MSTFVKLDDSDPYETFAVVMRRSRLGMNNAYLAAFAAHIRCAQLLQDHRWGTIGVSDAFGFPIFGVPEPVRQGPSEAELHAMWLDALAEDFQADQQASPVILVADDSLRRLARGIWGKPPTINEGGYGPTYGRGVTLTALLQAATNTLRHVSEWDETKTPSFPYQPPETFKKNSIAWKAMQSISIIQRAFGLGESGPIRDVVSMRVLIAVDGKLGTEAPSYKRFEEAVITAAREIAQAKGKTPARKLDEALQRQERVLDRAGRN